MWCSGLLPQSMRPVRRRSAWLVLPVSTLVGVEGSLAQERWCGSLPVVARAQLESRVKCNWG
jgi:hypothetical protein